MNYLEQLRLESAIRRYQTEFSERTKRATSRVSEMASAYGGDFLDDLDLFVEKFSSDHKLGPARGKYMVTLGPAGAVLTDRSVD